MNACMDRPWSVRCRRGVSVTVECCYGSVLLIFSCLYRSLVLGAALLSYSRWLQPAWITHQANQRMVLNRTERIQYTVTVSNNAVGFYTIAPNLPNDGFEQKGYKTQLLGKIMQYRLLDDSPKLTKE